MSNHAQSILRRGMTLIELLVVLGIIGILAGLLLPALTGSREKSRITFCQNNLRTIGQAIQSYCDENGDTFPSGSGRAGQPQWDLAILPYLNESKEVLVCPSDRLRESGNTNAPRTYAANAGANVGHGRYPFGFTSRAPLRTMELDNAPNDIILVGERPANRGADGEYDLSASRGYVGLTPYVTLEENPGSVHRDNRGGNYLFASAAVRYAATNEIGYVATTNYWAVP